MNFDPTILEFRGKVDVIPVEQDYWDDDSADIEDQAYRIARNSGIRIASNKGLAFVARDEDGVVLGGVWNNFEPDHDYDEEGEEEVWAYDFDVAVDEKSRTSGLKSAQIGIKLIDAAIDDFRDMKAEHNRAYIRVWVINPKLAKWLEYNRNFEPSGVGRDGTGHMTYNEDFDEYEGLDDVDKFDTGDVLHCTRCATELSANDDFHECGKCDAVWCSDCGRHVHFEVGRGGYYLYHDPQDYVDQYGRGGRGGIINCPACPPVAEDFDEYEGLDDADTFDSGEFCHCGYDENAAHRCGKCGVGLCDDCMMAQEGIDVCPDCYDYRDQDIICREPGCNGHNATCEICSIVGCYSDEDRGGISCRSRGISPNMERCNTCDEFVCEKHRSAEEIIEPGQTTPWVCYTCATCNSWPVSEDFDEYEGLDDADTFGEGIANCRRCAVALDIYEDDTYECGRCDAVWCPDCAEVTEFENGRGGIISCPACPPVDPRTGEPWVTEDFDEYEGLDDADTFGSNMDQYYDPCDSCGRTTFMSEMIICAGGCGAKVCMDCYGITAQPYPGTVQVQGWKSKHLEYSIDGQDESSTYPFCPDCIAQGRDTIPDTADDVYAGNWDDEDNIPPFPFTEDFDEYEGLDDADTFEDQSEEYASCDNCGVQYTIENAPLWVCECGHCFCDKCIPGGEYYENGAGYYSEDERNRKYRAGFGFDETRGVTHCPFCPDVIHTL